MVYLWGKSVEVCMKSMYFAFICGAIISPLVTAPFLAPEVKWMNATAADGPLSHYDVRESRIWIVYMINAIIAVIATSLFFHQCLVYSRFLHGRTVTTNNDIHVRHLSKKEKIIILLNMGLFFLVYSAIEETFTEYLTVFCVSRMGMTKTQGSQATSIYFAAFGVFRFLGIRLVASMDPIYLVVVYLVILILSFVGLVLTGAFIHVIGIWLFAPLVGIGLSIIYPILYTWTDEQFLPISGKIAAYLVTSASLGRIINAAILGHLMQFVTPVWYCYLLLIEALLFIVLYDVCLLLSRWIASKPDLESLSNSEFELDIIQKNFGLDQRYDPSIGSFDAKSPQPADTTGLQATVRLSSTTTRTKSKQSETGKLDSIYEDKLGTYV